MFADECSRFIELSDRTPESQDRRPDRRSEDEQRSRMNERYEALFAANRDIFEGARVLDLASHDGRWSFAALKAGAAHVTGVEVRQTLVDRASEAFAFYDQDPDTYRFVQGDLFEVLARERFDVDVVLCFGFSTTPTGTRSSCTACTAWPRGTWWSTRWSRATPGARSR